MKIECEFGCECDAPTEQLREVSLVLTEKDVHELIEAKFARARRQWELLERIRDQLEID